MKYLQMLLAMVCCSVLHGEVSEEPHLTPQKLLGDRFSKDTFNGIKVAVIGYCAPPSILEKYQLKGTKEQYFLHLSPESVKIGTFGDTKFLCLYHVYGACISAALVEELAYYGIDTILAYGYAGAIGSKNLKICDPFLIETAYPFEGCSKYYTQDLVIPSDQRLNEIIKDGWKGISSVHAGAVDVIYREYPWVVQDIASHNCDVVNCEASHLFAVAREVGIRAIECGIVTDIIQAKGGDVCEENLSEILPADSSTTSLPSTALNTVVQFLVEDGMLKVSKQ